MRFLFHSDNIRNSTYIQSQYTQWNLDTLCANSPKHLGHIVRNQVQVRQSWRLLGRFRGLAAVSAAGQILRRLWFTNGHCVSMVAALLCCCWIVCSDWIKKQWTTKMCGGCGAIELFTCAYYRRSCRVCKLIIRVTDNRGVCSRLSMPIDAKFSHGSGFVHHLEAEGMDWSTNYRQIRDTF